MPLSFNGESSDVMFPLRFQSFEPKNWFKQTLDTWPSWAKCICNTKNTSLNGDVAKIGTPPTKNHHYVYIIIYIYLYFFGTQQHIIDGFYWPESENWMEIGETSPWICTSGGEVEGEEGIEWGVVGIYVGVCGIVCSTWVASCLVSKISKYIRWVSCTKEIRS